MLRTAIASIPLLSLLGSVLAHEGCGGGELIRRNPRGRLPARQNTATTESSEAGITDPNAQCTGYSYAPLLALESTYPPVWQPATILANDTTAQALFATINATVNAKLPNDAPKCALSDPTLCHAGNFSGLTYDSASDPDCWWTNMKCTTPANASGLTPDITTVPQSLTWALGFDDGPNCSHNAFYDYLAEQNQKATMFYIGSNVFDWPLQALRAVDDGHQICVHTWSHRYMTSFSNADAFAELYYSRKIIKDILGVTPLCWRPPYGDVDDRIRMIAAGLNMTTIVWSEDTSDWREGYTPDVTAADVTTNYQNAINRTVSGIYQDHSPIVLTHELNNFTMDEAMTMYPVIKGAFKYIVPICAALNITYPYAETNITCPSFTSYIGGTVNITTNSTV